MMFINFQFIQNNVFVLLRFLSRLSWGFGSSADRLHVTESLWNPELLHGERVHQWEVSLDHLVTSVRMLLCHAVVQLQVHSVLGHPQGVGHVGTNQFKAFNTFSAGVGSGLLAISKELRFHITDTSSFADVDSSVIEVVVGDHVQHLNIRHGEI